MATQQLYFSRDTKVYIEFDGTVWDIPVLDGFSFSQSTNSSEITLAEMESADGVSRRGKKQFNDSLSPAEWSFSTYIRPFASAGGGAGAEDADSVAGNHHAVEEVLWAAISGANEFDGSDFARDSNPVSTTTGTGNTISLVESNKSTLGTFDLYFVTGDINKKVYKVKSSVVGDVSLDFDIDGIAMVGWSGSGTDLVDVTPTTTVGTVFPTIAGESISEGHVFLDSANGYDLSVHLGSDAWTARISEAITDTSNFIRNRLTSLTITDNDTSKTYSLTLTGGSISLANNNTYITPEELGVVNIPIGHVTGTRTISGSFTAYLSKEFGAGAADDQSSDFWDDLKAKQTQTTNSFSVTFYVGGASGTPRLELAMPKVHVDIPTHSIEDVIAIETSFNALPSTLDAADELTIKYVGA